jgi:crotonobetainyl-CoA:carnitine CoA-transferase CaiB-like acyl-CoA transferase
LLDTQVAMLANLGANYLVSGKVPGRSGNAHQNIVPYQVFETAAAPDASKDHIILAVGNDGQFARFCEVAGRPELAQDPRFARNQDRVRNRAVLVPLLEDVMKQRGKAAWRPWKQPRCPAARSTTWPRCSRTRMCARAEWSIHGSIRSIRRCNWWPAR